MKHLLLVLFFLFCGNAFSQKKWCVTIVHTDSTNIKEYTFKDTSKIRSFLTDYQYKYIDKSYPLAQFDSLVWNKPHDTLLAYFYRGAPFEHLQLSIQESDRQIIRKIPRISERLLAHVPFKSTEIADVYESILKYLENNGFPFARVQLTHIDFTDTSPSATLSIHTGEKIVWHEIFIKGEAKIAPGFVKTYLEIREGKPYSEKLFDDIPTKIQQLNFLALDQNPQVIFTPEGADLYLYLKSVPTSSADGILGMQPDTKGKITFTGNINLSLNNVIKRGESFSLSWKSLQVKTQQIEAQLKAPFLFKTPFGVEGNFHLYKRDSSFLEIKTMAGINYYLGKGSYLKGFYNFESSHTLSGAKNNPLYVNAQSVKTSYYGLGIVRNKVDYIPNPTRGLQLDINASLGLRTAMPKDSSGAVRKHKSTSSKIQSTISYFIPLGRRHTIRLGNITSGIYADTVYSNEQLRFGGLKAQRGFNEESIYATFFTTFSLEYRFLLDKNSNIFVFYDQSWYENRVNKYVHDTPLGFGLGLSFGTKVGTFSISYALGRQFSNPIQLKSGKIHFGYIAFF